MMTSKQGTCPFHTYLPLAAAGTAAVVGGWFLLNRSSRSAPSTAAAKNTATTAASSSEGRSDITKFAPVVGTLCAEAVDWAAAHGLAMGEPGKHAGAGALFSHVPCALLPTPYPRPAFERALALAEGFNTLVDRVARDPAWLLGALREAAAADADFTGRLVAVFERVLAAEAAQPGSTQRWMLGVHRSDYMLHVGDGGGARTAAPVPMQVELNTIASSFGCVSAITTRLHRYLLGRFGDELRAAASARGGGNGASSAQQPPAAGGPDWARPYCAPNAATRVPDNAARERIPAAIALAHRVYESERRERLAAAAATAGASAASAPSSGKRNRHSRGTLTPGDVRQYKAELLEEERRPVVVLFVVQEGERNAIDQRWLEYALWGEHGVKVVRRTLRELHAHARRDAATGRLLLRLRPGAGDGHGGGAPSPRNAAGLGGSPRSLPGAGEDDGLATMASGIWSPPGTPVPPPAAGGEDGDADDDDDDSCAAASQVVSGWGTGAGEVEVSVAYFRAGYTPRDYPTEAEWEARAMLELSRAVKCPSVAYQLVGAKKVQQRLAAPGQLERFFAGGPGEAATAAALRTSFAGLWSLGGAGANGKAEEEDAAAAARLDALRDPGRFVMKPQREGGGNNVYGDAVADALAAMPAGELAGYILMQRLFPPQHDAVLVRHGKPHSGPSVSELGVFGTFLGNGGDGGDGSGSGSGATTAQRSPHGDPNAAGDEPELYDSDDGDGRGSPVGVSAGGVRLNAMAGHLLRTKFDGVDEGGVATGFAVLDSPFLVD